MFSPAGNWVRFVIFTFRCSGFVVITGKGVIGRLLGLS